MSTLDETAPLGVTPTTLVFGGSRAPNYVPGSTPKGLNR